MTGHLAPTGGCEPLSRAALLAARAMSETELQDNILTLCPPAQFLPYHTYDSRHSHKGFPDLVLASERQSRLIFAELKRESGRQSPDQAVWERVLRSIGIEFYLWRPRDWFDGTIRSVLLPPRTPRSAL